MLGGAIDQAIGATRGQTTIVDAASRITEAAVLARRFPEATLVHTGGSSSLLGEIGNEADDAKRLWVALGIEPDRIRTEDKSRNTFENAEFSRLLVASAAGPALASRDLGLSHAALGGAVPGSRLCRRSPIRSISARRAPGAISCPIGTRASGLRGSISRCASGSASLPIG